MGKNRKIDMVILGLLSHEFLTGYDIKKQIDSSIHFFWKGSFGSIYPALGEMEKTGLVSKREAPIDNSARERIEYSITSRGRKVLEDWLKDSQASNELKYETLLKLFFSGNCEKNVAISNIMKFREETEKELSILKFYEANLLKVQDEKDHVYFYLTVLFGERSYETYLKWCDEAVEILENSSAIKIDTTFSSIYTKIR